MASKEILPPNHCSHVVKYYEYRSKNAPQPVAFEIAPWILLNRTAQAYANCMIMPSRFNVI